MIVLLLSLMVCNELYVLKNFLVVANDYRTPIMRDFYNDFD